MAGAEAELTHRLKEHSEVIKFAQEVLGIMTSTDLEQDTRKSADAVDKVRSKISRSKENVHSLLRGESICSIIFCNGAIAAYVY